MADSKLVRILRKPLALTDVEIIEIGLDEDRTAARRIEAVRIKREKRQVSLHSCLNSLHYIEKIAEERAVRIDKRAGRFNIHVLSKQQVADALHITYTTLCNRIRDKVIPAPILYDNMSANSSVYYSVDEAKALVRLIGEHENEFVYLRKNHKEAIARIHAELKTVRSKF